MENAFASIANVRLPSASRLLPSSWCPDKDLLVIVTRAAGRDRLSLWKMQGSKKWEIDIDRGAAGGETIVDVAWSPDGMVLAVAHDPPGITLHSIQDGRQQSSLSTRTPSPPHGRKPHLRGIWWFKEEKKPQEKHSMPDIFKRRNDITGSAHSILKGQPLLDTLHDESQSLTATELFAFQGSHSRAVGKVSQPEVISSWPTLPPDPLAATMQTSRPGKQQSRPGEELDEVDDINVNSVLVVSDDLGNVHYFLDGSYPLGVTSLDSICSTISFHKANQVTFVAHSELLSPSGLKYTNLRPTTIQLPFLGHRAVRDVARVSTSARELAWYAMRLVKEMRSTWFGSDTQSGARELGPKWIRTLESRQREQFGEEEPNAMLDLTCLLVTGRASEALADYLGSGEQMSERGIQKWEATVIESLLKLRDYSEKRLAPACQRLHILLEEALGWSQLPLYALCMLPTAEIRSCLELASRAIICARWLAATARKELSRFREFIFWLRYETTRATMGVDAHNHPPPRHDLVEVNEYLTSGLVVSSIDKWFMGPVPQFSLADLGVPVAQDLNSSVEVAHKVLQNPRGLVWPPDVKQPDLSRLDRNLDSLIQELSTRCQKIFTEAANATSRSVIIHSSHDPTPVDDVHTRQSADAPRFIRERTVVEVNQDDSFLQYLAMQTPHAAGRSYLLLVQLHHSGSAFIPASVAALECCIPGKTGSMEEFIPIDLLDADFFDERMLTIVYRTHNNAESAFIATVGYADLSYQPIDPMGYVRSSAREDLMLDLLQRLRDGQLGAVQLPIIQSSPLGGCKEGKVTLAVNGRVGRRVACVLNDEGLALEILDMEGEEEEEEESMVATDG